MQTPSYKGIIATQTRQVFDASISTKIFQHINRVRDASHQGQARRWIWELIQNAKDAAYPHLPARIHVVYTGDKLVFSHTGRPFTIKNVLSIINQVSSKSPDDGQTTGKFGTGFITTHLLSETVELTGVISDTLRQEGGEEQLPSKPFTVLLDRSGTTQEEILEAVNVAVNVIVDLDDAPTIHPQPGNFHTTFTYFLTTPASAQIAQIGMEDLSHSVVYALAFTPGVAELTLENQVTGTKRTYSAPTAPTGGMDLFQVAETTARTTKTHTLLLAKRGQTALAVPVEGDVFLPISPQTPRLFADFPLIGSESFPVPVVCNNPTFLPDELRSGIPLSANQNSLNSAHNKRILEEMVTLYGALVKHCVAQGYHHFYHIAHMGDMPQRPDLDQEWVATHLYGAVLEKLYHQAVVETEMGMYPPSMGVYFPCSEEETERQAIAQALAMCQRTVPLAADCQGWYQAFSGQAVVGFDMEQRLKTAQTLVLEAGRMQKFLGDRYLVYVQHLYNMALKNPALRLRIEGGEVAIFPDQTPQQTLRTATQIQKDCGLDTPIKEALTLLDQTLPIDSQEAKCIYQRLLHRDFHLGDVASITTLSPEALFVYIEGRLDFAKHRLVRNYQEICQAAFAMVSCHKDPFWLEICKVIHPKAVASLTHNPSALYGEAGWRNAVITCINLVSRGIGACKTSGQIQKAYFPLASMDKVYQWLSAFYKQSFAYTTYLVKSPIYPNQRGDLCPLQGLYQDGGIDETLKDILESLRSDPFFMLTGIRDYRTDLLHPGITAFPTPNYTVQVLTNRDIAGDIVQCINQVFNKKNLADASDQIQDACTQLLGWIQGHEAQSQTLFTAFYASENRMKLLTTRAAARLTQEVHQVRNLLAQYGVSDLEAVLQGATIPSPYVYDQEDVYVEFDQEDTTTQAERRDYGNRVGQRGQELALSYLVARWVEKGYEVVSITAQATELVGVAGTVTLRQGDTPTHRQEGWDICQSVEGQAPTYYEVKSTVAATRRHQLRLSNAQATLAMQLGGHYGVVHVLMDKDLSCAKDITLFHNLPAQLEQGNMRIAQGGMVLQMLQDD